MTAAVCLVTGAGKGIGRAVAQSLSAQGHRVALASRNKADLERGRGDAGRSRARRPDRRDRP